MRNVRDRVSIALEEAMDHSSTSTLQLGVSNFYGDESSLFVQRFDLTLPVEDDE
jgi:hypothetical protein